MTCLLLEFHHPCYLVLLILASVTWLKLQIRLLVQTTKILQLGGKGRKRINQNFCECLVLVMFNPLKVQGVSKVRAIF